MNFDAGQFWEKRLARLTNLEGVGCEGRSIAWNRALYRTKTRVFKRMLRRWGLTLNERSFLDIGCGIGFWIDFLDRQGASQVAGVDIAETAVLHCQNRFAEKDHLFFRHADFGDPALDLGDWQACFDMITAFDVFYHITDGERFDRAVANVASALRPGGYFLVSDLFAKQTLSPQEHVVWRSLSTYRQVLGAHRLSVIDILPVTVFLNSPLNTSGLWGRFLRLLYYKVTFKMTRHSESDGMLPRIWLRMLYHFEAPLLTLFPRLGISNRLLLARKEPD